MSSKIKAAFCVDMVECLLHGQRTVHLRAVTTYDGDEWADLAEATPDGKIEMMISPGHAVGEFKPGDTYRLTFERVDEDE